jgi:hypothetical protein
LSATPFRQADVGVGEFHKVKKINAMTDRHAKLSERLTLDLFPQPGHICAAQ